MLGSIPITPDKVKIILLFIILLIASVKDMHDRIIPDWMPFLVMMISMLPGSLPRPAGLLACIPLLVATLATSGVGGGDIKMVAAIGTVVGLVRTFEGVIAALILMILFHGGMVLGRIIISKQKISKKRNQEAYPMIPFLFVGMIIALSLGA